MQISPGMDNQNNSEIARTHEYPAAVRVQARVWQHPFAFEETPDRGFNILFERGLLFYLMAILSLCLAVPLLISTGISMQALIRDPFEGFMLFFTIFLNLLRVLAAVTLYKYVRDAWRKVRFDSFDQMITIENLFPWFELRRTQVYHVSDAAGLEIRILKTASLTPAADEDDPENPACEVLMQLHDGSAVVLIPRVESVQAARTIAYEISGLTGLSLLTDIHRLYRQLEQLSSETRSIDC
ncbi:MAG TPA: hypothetical protein DCG57_05975 [Candidatus Riflebacteria bacterium]|jgi:hypothetical protein|nr:hypothetical protein [Candidatus Riflebacteria bacterium]